MAKGLGKGLTALFGEDAASFKPEKVIRLRLSEIEPNPNQPRKNFDGESLSLLAESIKQHGLLQPITVRKRQDGAYEIISGERRWRASRKAGLTSIDAVVLEADDVTGTVLALVENLQREDLNPVEEANGYATLLACGMTQEEAAVKVGKPRSSIANSVRLLSLPEDVLNMLAEGKITEGHAKVLLSAGDRASVLAEKCVSEGLSVRALESLLREKKEKKEYPQNEGVDYYAEAARDVSERLGRRVTIKKGKKKGLVTIEYYGVDDLEELLERIR